MLLARTFMIAGAAVLLLAAWRAGAAYSESRSTLPAVQFSDEARPTLVVVFQPADCSTYEGFIEQWAELRSGWNIQVIGAVVNAPRHAGGKLHGPVGFAPAYPVRLDLDRMATDLVRRTGYQKTPVAILLDAQGRPRMIVPPHPNPRQRARMREIAGNYAETLSPR